MKVKLASFVVGAAFLALPLAAFAATNIQTLTVNGATNATVSQGDDVDSVLRVAMTGNDDIESISYEVLGSGFGPQCVDVSDQINTGTYDFPITIDGKNFSNAGTWNLQYKAYGVNGSGTDQDCSGSANDTMSFSGRVTVLSNTVVSGTGSTTTAGDSAPPSWVSQMIAAIVSALKPAATPAPTASSDCSMLTGKLAGTQMNTYNDANVRLQGFLLSEGASIPALKAGASFGFYGNQTAAAVAWFNATFNCR